MVTLALCACLAGLLALRVIQRGRHPDRDRSSESQNALDLGLVHLIKSIERETSEPVAAPSVSRTRTMGDMTSASVSARSRLARGTPVDPAVLAPRQPVTTPLLTPALPRTSTPARTMPMATGSSSRIAAPRGVQRTGFEPDDDDAPTKLSHTLADRPIARR